MNRLSAVVAVVLCLSLAAAIILKRASAPQAPASSADEPFVSLQDGTLLITGQNVTLGMLEKAIRDPRVFRLDPSRGAYFCNANLELAGSLRIGRPGRPEDREILEFQTFACGDRSIRIRQGGKLSVHHSEIATVIRQIDAKLCSKGYTVVTDGELVLEHATLAYMSGSFGRPARRGASCRIANSGFIHADGNAFFADDVDASRIEIRDSRFESHGNSGFIVAGPGRGALRLVRCRLRGAASDLHHAGKDAEVVLLDCDFRKDTISFNQLNGIITVKWTVPVQVLDALGGPVRGATLQARSDPACGEIEDGIAAVTDADGRAQLVLTEFVADPFNPKRIDGINNRTPHNVWASDTRGKVQAETKIEAAGPSQSLTLRVAESSD